jgi:phospholipid transport system substrate-binding protein
MGFSFLKTCIAAEVQQGEEGKFIQTLYEKSIHDLKSPNLTSQDRESRFRDLFLKHFDLEAIARFVVGREALQKNSEKKFNDFKSSLENYIVKHYSDQFQTHDANSFKVKKVIKGQRLSTISTDVVIKDRKSAEIRTINMDWQVLNKQGQFKIFDLIVESISLVITKQGEFRNILNNNNHDLSSLIKALDQKTEAGPATKSYLNKRGK